MERHGPPATKTSLAESPMEMLKRLMKTLDAELLDLSLKLQWKGSGSPDCKSNSKASTKENENDISGPLDNPHGDAFSLKEQHKENHFERNCTNVGQNKRGNKLTVDKNNPDRNNKLNLGSLHRPPRLLKKLKAEKPWPIAEGKMHGTDKYRSSFMEALRIEIDKCEDISKKKNIVISNYDKYLSNKIDKYSNDNINGNYNRFPSRCNKNSSCFTNKGLSDYYAIVHKNNSKRYRVEGNLNSVTLEKIRRLLANNTDDLNLNTYDTAKAYERKIMEAYKDRRIFIIHGNFPSLRDELLSRGWLEKLCPVKNLRWEILSERLAGKYGEKPNDCENIIISKVLQDFPAFFIWQPKAYEDIYVDVLPHRNHIRRSGHFDFTTKVGLIGCAEQELWYTMEDQSRMLHPRFYRLCLYTDGRDGFMEDFYNTQCRNLVGHLIEHIDDLVKFANPTEGNIDAYVLKFGVKQLKRRIMYEKGDEYTIDHTIPVTGSIQWNDFIKKSNLIINGRGKFKMSLPDISQLVVSGKEFLEKLKEMHPDYEWDGLQNLWILKPGYRSCGNGILIKNSLDDVMKFASNNICSQYIVQKYVGE